MRTCCIDGCGGKLTSKIHCAKHHKRFKRYGDANFTKTAPTGEPLFFLESALLSDTEECIDWPYANRFGYGAVRYRGRDYVASRLVCERLNGPPPPGWIDAAHSCGRGSNGCINPKHLRWASRLENSADKEIHGTVNNGVRNGSAKLTEEQIGYVRSQKGIKLQREIAKELGVSQTLISAVMRGKVWGWLNQTSGSSEDGILPALLHPQS